MKKTRTFLKSAAEDEEDLESQETLETGAQVEDEDSDQFEVDEAAIDEIADAEEFAGTDISKEDIIDAIQAIDALADAVIEKSDAEEVPVDADALIDEVQAMIEAPAEEEIVEDDFELEEDEELPEELTNAAVRVMVSEDGATTVESTPDTVYDSDIDGMDCTVFDTCEEVPMEIEDEGESEDDELLVVGNSKATKFKKGFVTLKSNANKRAWSAAVKKVRKMVGSSKLTKAHWVIVSALAAKLATAEAEKKTIQSKVLKVIKNSKNMKVKLAKLLKSDADIDPAGQTAADVKVEETAGTEIAAKEEGAPEKETSPEYVDSTAGDPVEDPQTQEESEGEFVDVPTAPLSELEVPIENSRYTLTLKKLSSSKRSGKTMFIVESISKGSGNKGIRAVKSGAKKPIANSAAVKTALDGKVVSLKNGVAIAFKNTVMGLLGCACKFENTGKGNYKVCLKNGHFVIAQGKECNVFSNAEKVIMAQKIASARAEGYKEGKSEATKLFSARMRSVEARAQRQIASAKHIASAGERQLKQIHAQEERERLFQSSQRAMNEDKAFIKESNTRNTEALNDLYSRMF